MGKGLRQEGITARILDLVIEEKGLYFLAEYLLRRFSAEQVQSALAEARERSKLIARVDAGRSVKGRFPSVSEQGRIDDGATSRVLEVGEALQIGLKTS